MTEKKPAPAEGAHTTTSREADASVRGAQIKPSKERIEGSHTPETEPRRVSRRLLILRGWSHDEANPTLFP